LEINSLINLGKEKIHSMQSFFTDYLSNLNELHTDILRTISDLPHEALDWSPFSGGNSCSVIITHIAGAEKYWLGDVVAGVPSGRDRNAEFSVKNLTVGELEARLQESLSYVGDVLVNLVLGDLETTRISPRNDQEVTIAWALDHTLKHTAVHLGHIQITCQLWEEHQGK
jgi:uncharacterized damage-inducible protein DinB